MIETFGERIKRLRESRRQTQEQIAVYLHLTRNVIGSYERNEREPSLKTIVLLAKHFHVTTDYLLGVGRSRNINVSGLNEREYLLVKELVSLISEKNNKQ